MTASSPVRTDHEFVKCALDADESTNAIVRGVDAIVYVARPPADAAESEQIDYQTRCTYNLLRAAVDQGVRNVVMLSSLRSMTGYEASFQVDENWRPLPTIACGGLPEHLGEFVCREFTHQGDLNIIVLRLGNVARAEALKGKPADPLWVDPRDVAQAVRRSLAVLFANRQPGLGYWSIFHIQSDSPQSEFSIRKAERFLGYRPQYRR
jgi:nucleoside-diphosphate-sugar epimerase